MREELQMARASGKVIEGEIDTDKDFKTSAKFFQKMQANVEHSIRDDIESTLGKRKRGFEPSSGSKSSSFKM